MSSSILSKDNATRKVWDPLEIVKRLFKLILIGIGLGILSGTFLRIVPNKINFKSPDKKTYSNKRISNRSYKERTEDKSINLRWEKISNNYGDLQVSGYVIFDNGNYAQINADKKLPAASTIKISILLLSLELLDKGKLEWDELLTIKKNLIAGGSGWMRYQQLGSKFPVHEIATEMIRVSDNTATNLLIEKLGGLNYINNRLLSLGLKETQLQRLLPDLEGLNITTSRDLTRVLFLAESGNFLSQKSRDIFREIMSTSLSNNLLPKGILNGLEKNIALPQGDIDYKLLIKGFRIYNKTGDIGIAYGDAGIIEMPNTDRALAAFLVKGPFNDPRSAELIRQMSEALINSLQKSNKNKMNITKS